ncbi:hypothetical protein M9435_000398 [Picochlorum sp. BPE23]|nr:hypothetical protein M9435_000398 [Picochlorum sp. BPE23]
MVTRSEETTESKARGQNGYSNDDEQVLQRVSEQFHQTNGGTHPINTLHSKDTIVKHGIVEEKVVPTPVIDRDVGCFTETEIDDKIQSIFEDYQQYLETAQVHQLGYPINHTANKYIDLSPLVPFQKYYLNNVGSPEDSVPFASHSHAFELGVLHWFADLWNLDKDDLWGYITTGGTESNLQALYTARENFPQGVLYLSKEAHFSLFKASHLLRMDTVIIDTSERGELKYEDLQRELVRNKGRPAILALTFGTTMKGAIDDPTKALACLKAAGYASNFYIHVDAALSGIFVPLLGEDSGAPRLSFAEQAISSVSVSGHKFLGSPIPCGVILIRKQFIENIGRNVEYIFSKDITLTCSRSGHSSLMLWFMISKLGRKHIRDDGLRCIRYAQELQKKLSSSGIYSYVNPWSITVVFEKPNDMSFLREWQLAAQQDICHVVVMPHLQKETLDIFADELIACIKKSDSGMKARLKADEVSKFEEAQQQLHDMSFSNQHCIPRHIS